MSISLINDNSGLNASSWLFGRHMCLTLHCRYCCFGKARIWTVWLETAVHLQRDILNVWVNSSFLWETVIGYVIILIFWICETNTLINFTYNWKAKETLINFAYNWIEAETLINFAYNCRSLINQWAAELRRLADLTTWNGSRSVTNQWAADEIRRSHNVWFSYIVYDPVRSWSD